MEWISNPDAWLGLFTLTFLEIVLGVDNIIFISIAAGKLPGEQRSKATNIGLFLAMIMRIALLFGINILISMKEPWIEFHASWFHGAFSGQSLILLAGGIFLLYKSTSEIHHKLEGIEHHESSTGKKVVHSLGGAILQITVINIVFSFDSILTAVGMTNGLPNALTLMIIAVVLSMLIMMLFAAPVGKFVNEHPTIQMLGLSFLILIGFMLITESAHLGHLVIMGNEVGAIPKGYLYFAISFSLAVEFLNMRLRKKGEPVHLHSHLDQ
ncbi:TerC family protein [Solitalea lacus]|uniref:TerC family protein n=1 Tax=Solitalea lacus TaxID=2911172 RepID=UPI001EDB0EAD|nr:TerC family protein [Solitalea lacus]UKJ07571.1 TerC family protein [Solitalea lacus]